MTEAEPNAGAEGTPIERWIALQRQLMHQFLQWPSALVGRGVPPSPFAASRQSGADEAPGEVPAGVPGPGGSPFDAWMELHRLVRGEFELGGRTVDLGKVTMPVLNIFAEGDHIIPPKGSQALAEHIGTDDYTEIPLPGGQVGVFVSGKSQGILGKGILGWLREHP